VSLAEKIIRHVQALPETQQVEVLDFVEYLHAKMSRKKNLEWTDFSLASAMRGMEGEQTPYSLCDLQDPPSDQ
jgi:hypothetical protein